MAKQKQNKKRLSQRQQLWVAGLVLAALIVVTQAALDYQFWRSPSTAASNVPLIHMLTNAVSDLSKPAPVEARTGRVYIREAGLVLPASNDVYGLRYYYENYEAPYDLRVTTDGILNKAENKLWMADANSNGDPQTVISKVPNLQACARGVLASFGTPKDVAGLSAEGKVRLADGREMYLYVESNCDDNLVAVADYLKSAESY